MRKTVNATADNQMMTLANVQSLNLCQVKLANKDNGGTARLVVSDYTN